MNDKLREAVCHHGISPVDSCFYCELKLCGRPLRSGRGCKRSVFHEEACFAPHPTTVFQHPWDCHCWECDDKTPPEDGDVAPPSDTDREARPLEKETCPDCGYKYRTEKVYGVLTRCTNRDCGDWLDFSVTADAPPSTNPDTDEEAKIDQNLERLKEATLRKGEIDHSIRIASVDGEPTDEMREIFNVTRKALRNKLDNRFVLGWVLAQITLLEKSVSAVLAVQSKGEG